MFEVRFKEDSAAGEERKAKKGVAKREKTEQRQKWMVSNAGLVRR